MSTTYLNTKLYGVIETIDSLSSKDFPCYRDFVKEKKRLKSEYILCGWYGHPYWSQRPTKTW